MQFGQINKHLEIISAIPGRGFGEGSSVRWLKTWGGQETQSQKYLQNLSKPNQIKQTTLTSLRLGESEHVKLFRKDRYPIITPEV